MCDSELEHVYDISPILLFNLLLLSSRSLPCSSGTPSYTHIYMSVERIDHIPLKDLVHMDSTLRSFINLHPLNLHKELNILFKIVFKIDLHNF